MNAMASDEAVAASSVEPISPPEASEEPRSTCQVDFNMTHQVRAHLSIRMHHAFTPACCNHAPQALELPSVLMCTDSNRP